MGVMKADLHDELLKRRTLKVFDDFVNYASGNLWTAAKSAGMTVAAGDGQGGLLNLTGDANLNDEAYVAMTNQPFLFAANRPIMAEAFVQYAEANTNKANVAFGFMSSVGAASLVNGTGEPKANFSGAIIYKVPGGTQWKTCSSVGGVSNVSQSNTQAGGANFVRLEIICQPVTATVCEVTYYVDGIQLFVAGQRTPIKDQLTYTGAAAMGLFVALKQGSTTAESLVVDYIAAEALRAQFV